VQQEPKVLKVVFHLQDQQVLKEPKVDKGSSEPKVRQDLVVLEEQQEPKVLKVVFHLQDQQEPKEPKVDKGSSELKVR
jgi:hypothetical protein